MIIAIYLLIGLALMTIRAKLLSATEIESAVATVYGSNKWLWAIDFFIVGSLLWPISLVVRLVVLYKYKK